jgi:Putative beta-barrel porin 2
MMNTKKSVMRPTRRIWSASGVALAACLMAAQPTFAQNEDSHQIDQIRADSRMHASAFYVTPRLQVKQFGVDSNVFNQATDPKSDFSVNFSPTVDVAVPMAHRALFRASEATDLVYFAKYGTERSVDPHLTTRVEVYLHRVTLFGGGSVVSSRQRPNFEIDARSRRFEGDMRAGAAVHVTPRFSMEMAADRQKTTYDPDATFAQGVAFQTTLNRSSEGFSVTPSFLLTPYTTISARLQAFRDQFTFDSARDSRSVQVMPGVEFKPRAVISGEAFVGYRRLKPSKPESLPAFSGIVADVGLSYRLLSTTRIDFTVDRDVRYSAELLQPYYIDNSLGASIRRALGSDFDVLLHGEVHRYQYQNYQAGVPAAAGLADRLDRTVSYSASVGYRVRRGVRLGIGVTSYDRVSPRAGRSYHGLRIGTDLTYGL